ncbi:MAG: sulfurtransferase, partial [Alphaproteobacteria bacterium]|nr:sulfurtransferase [Alphaproteobacteria bacterium]
GTTWLAERLGDPSLRILDCSWYLPEQARDARAEFEAAHIPGAAFFDLDDIRDKASPFANMLPGPDEFAAKVGALGIANDTPVVIYDSSYVSARVWWMFRIMGHDDVRILDGGWGLWKSEARPVAAGPARHAPRKFSARLRPDLLAGLDDVRAAARTRSAQLVDARTAQRFTAEQPSGYPGIPGGHIPGSRNIPWSTLQDSRTRAYLPLDQLSRAFAAAGIDVDKPVIATCGSGVTACMLALSLHRMGKDRWRVYDGSWHEWAQQPDTPKATGPSVPKG